MNSVRNSPTLAIVAALRDEAASASRCLVTGMGPQRMCAALEKLQADCVVLIGFAGGLDPQLRGGDLLRVGCVLHEGNPPIELPGASGGATLLTVDDLADTPQRKAALRQATGADATDMESYFAARLLQQRGIPLTILRAITDPADVALPRASMQWVKPDGSHDVPAVLRYLLMHPHHLPRLLRLGSASRRAAKVLGDAVGRLRTDGTL